MQEFRALPSPVSQIPSPISCSPSFHSVTLSISLECASHQFQMRFPRDFQMYFLNVLLMCTSQVCISSTLSIAPNCIGKMYFCHWEYLGVFGSCRTRIPGWSNLGVDCTDAVAFWCTWERWRQICEDTGGLVTISGAPGNAGHKLGSTSNRC
jgi:hypothetical protein